MSNLGGALSLYMGVTLIMTFELVELAIDMFLNVWAHLMGGKGM